MMEINEMIFKFGNDLINQKECVILTHVNADGDCIGSAVALCIYLDARNIKTRIIVEEKIPEKYGYLDPEKKIQVYTGQEIHEDFIVALDTGDFKRLGKRGEVLNRRVSWNIDHHKTNTAYAINNLIDLNASSTGEII